MGAGVQGAYAALLSSSQLGFAADVGAALQSMLRQFSGTAVVGADSEVCLF